MGTLTNPKVWPTDKPLVVFLTPGVEAHQYAALMVVLINQALEELGWDSDRIEVVGLIAPTAQSGTEGIRFLDEIGVDSRRVELLVLLGETADSVQFGDDVPYECGIGFVVLPESGAIIPAIRMPAIDDGWWLDALHQQYASTTFTGLLRDGKLHPSPEHSEHVVFISDTAFWN